MPKEAGYLRDVAELALESRSLNEFHREFVERTADAVGASGGAALTRRVDGSGDVVCNMVDGLDFARAFALHHGELTKEERERSRVKRATTLEEMHPDAHRRELSFYRDYLRAHSAEKAVFRFWSDETSIHFFAFTAPRTANFLRYTMRAKKLLDDVFPVVAVAERLYGSRGWTPDGSIPHSACLKYRLTPSEQQTMNLLVRGLTNAEIGSALEHRSG